MKALCSGVLAVVLLAGAFWAGWQARGRQRPDGGRIVETRVDTVYCARPIPAAQTRRRIAVSVPRVLFAPAAAVAENKTIPAKGRQRANNAPSSSSGSCLHLPDRAADLSEIPNASGSCSANLASAADCSEIPNASDSLSEFPTGSALRDSRLSDSLQMCVDLETRIYEDSLYRAEVSGPVLGGCRPSLDRIELYARTKTVTQTVTRRSRFAITAGVGAAYTPRGLQPAVGVQLGVVLWGF